MTRGVAQDRTRKRGLQQGPGGKEGGVPGENGRDGKEVGMIKAFGLVGKGNERVELETGRRIEKMLERWKCKQTVTAMEVGDKKMAPRKTERKEKEQGGRSHELSG